MLFCIWVLYNKINMIFIYGGVGGIRMFYFCKSETLIELFLNYYTATSLVKSQERFLGTNIIFYGTNKMLPLSTSVSLSLSLCIFISLPRSRMRGLIQ